MSVATVIDKQVGKLKNFITGAHHQGAGGHGDRPRRCDAVRTLGLKLQVLEARRAEDIDSAFAAMSLERAGAVLPLPDTMLILQRAPIADLAAKTCLPVCTRRGDT